MRSESIIKQPQTNDRLRAGAIAILRFIEKSTNALAIIAFCCNSRILDPLTTLEATFRYKSRSHVETLPYDVSVTSNLASCPVRAPVRACMPTDPDVTRVITEGLYSDVTVQGFVTAVPFMCVLLRLARCCQLGHHRCVHIVRSFAVHEFPRGCHTFVKAVGSPHSQVGPGPGGGCSTARQSKFHGL